MNFSRLLTLAILLAATAPCFGQSTDGRQDTPVYGALYERGLRLTWSPLSLISGRPAFMVGALYATGRWAYGVEVEYGPNFLVASRNDPDPHGYELYGLRTEVRRIFADLPDPKISVTHYVGLQGSYRTAYRDLAGREYRSHSGEYLQFDRARREEKRTDAVLMYHLRFSGPSRIYLEGYLGGGISYRAVDYHRQENVREAASGIEYIIVPWLLLSRRSAEEGSYFRPAVRAGFKIGYLL